MHADPHHNEYLAAVAGMNEIYRSDRPSPGDYVYVERPFYGDTVKAKVIRTHGHLVTVEIDGDHLGYTVDEVRLTN